jgi:hypothetical protein
MRAPLSIAVVWPEGQLIARVFDCLDIWEASP